MFQKFISVPTDAPTVKLFPSLIACATAEGSLHAAGKHRSVWRDGIQTPQSLHLKST